MRYPSVREPATANGSSSGWRPTRANASRTTSRLSAELSVIGDVRVEQATAERIGGHRDAVG